MTALEAAKKRAQELCFAGGSLADEHAKALDDIAKASRTEALMDVLTESEKPHAKEATSAIAKWRTLASSDRMAAVDALLVAYEGGELSEAAWNAATLLLNAAGGV